MVNTKDRCKLCQFVLLDAIVAVYVVFTGGESNRFAREKRVSSESRVSQKKQAYRAKLLARTEHITPVCVVNDKRFDRESRCRHLPPLRCIVGGQQQHRTPTRKVTKE